MKRLTNQRHTYAFKEVHKYMYTLYQYLNSLHYNVFKTST